MSMAAFIGMFGIYNLLNLLLICITLSTLYGGNKFVTIFIERIVNDVITPGIANGWDSVKTSCSQSQGVWVLCGLIAPGCICRIYGARYAGILYRAS